jgi:hypothetical protein
MGWLLLGSVGAFFGGFYFILRDLLPYLAAQRSGVIARKGARSVRVRRDENPEGFQRLMANRGKGIAFGSAVSAAGLLVLGLFGLAAFGTSGPLALLIFAIFIGFAAFAGVCLVRGLVTGRMFAFFSIALHGEATLKGNPTWFWIYAALNLVVVLGGVRVLLGLFVR